MLKQIFISSAVLLASMSQMVSSQSASVANSPNVMLPTANTVNYVNTNSSSTINFAVGNYLSVNVDMRFSSADGRDINLVHVVPAGAINYELPVPEGVYNLTVTPLGVGSYMFQMGCGYRPVANNYTFNNITVSQTRCNSMNISNFR